jgi:hypothetical protein
MIEIYLSIAKCLSQIPEIKWVDMAPKTDEQISLFPAAFVEINNVDFEELLEQNYRATFQFTITFYLKPYDTSYTTPQSPALAQLADKFAVISQARKAINLINDNTIGSVTLIRETLQKNKEKQFVCRQTYKATTAWKY